MKQNREDRWLSPDANAWGPLFEVNDPQMRGTIDEFRLTKQCKEILARLKQGPATNDELSRISRKYTSRISDLRMNGINVVLKSWDHKTGVTVYVLEESA